MFVGISNEKKKHFFRFENIKVWLSTSISALTFHCSQGTKPNFIN